MQIHSRIPLVLDDLTEAVKHALVCVIADCGAALKLTVARISKAQPMHNSG